MAQNKHKLCQTIKTTPDNYIKTGYFMDFPYDIISDINTKFTNIINEYEKYYYDLMNDFFIKLNNDIISNAPVSLFIITVNINDQYKIELCNKIIINLKYILVQKCYLSNIYNIYNDDNTISTHIETKLCKLSKL